MESLASPSSAHNAESRVAVGVWPTMLTPFTEQGAIDWAGLDALIEWYLEAGVAGLFAVCLSSEMYALSPEERRKLAAHVVARVDGRVGVIAAGAFGADLAEQAAAVHRLADTGVDLVVLTANLLVGPEADESAWQEAAEALLTACPEVPLGLYECPQPDHRLLSTELLGWAAQTGRFHFLKDTCTDAQRMRARLAAVADTPMRCFNANAPTLLRSLQDGGHGYASVAANFFPAHYAWLCANVHRQPERAAALHRFLCVADLAGRFRYPRSAKAFLALGGLPIREVCRVDVPVVGPEHRLSLARLHELAAAQAATEEG